MYIYSSLPNVDFIVIIHKRTHSMESNGLPELVDKKLQNAFVPF